tara:strand:+ start:3261 stop:3521 length:261 start_codon:yes stop_codon:yes gene_type:complete
LLAKNVTIFEMGIISEESALHHNTKGTLVKKIHGITFDKKLNYNYNYESLKDLPDSFRLGDVFFVNNVNGDTILEHIYINYIYSID